MRTTARQDRLYTHSAVVYRQKRMTGGDFGYQLVGTITGYFFNTLNIDSPTEIGLLKHEMALTYDRFRCRTGEDVRAQDMIYWTASNEWYKVIADPLDRPGSSTRGANFKLCLLSKNDAPAVVVS